MNLLLIVVITMTKKILFLFLSVVSGFFGLYFFNGFDTSVFSLQPLNFFFNADPFLLFLIVCSLFFTLYLPAFRLKILSSSHGYFVSLFHASLVHSVGMFSAAITPGGSGSTPALIGGLSSLSIPLGGATALSIQLLILDIFFFAFTVPLAGFYFFASVGFFSLHLFILIILFPLFAFFVFLLLVRRPEWILRLFIAFAGFAFLRRSRYRLFRFYREYRSLSRSFSSFSLLRILVLIMLSFFYWINLFTLFWLFFQAFSAAGFLNTFSALLLSTFASMFAPTPGGSGFIEFFVQTGLPVGSSVAEVLVLWRVFTFYVFFVLGPLSAWYLSRLRRQY